MVRMKKDKPVVITQFKWEGRLGPFHIKTSCGECNLVTSILKNTMENEFKNKNVRLELKPWLNNFFYCILRLTWHPPIIMVNGRRFYQFTEKQPLFDKQKLVELVNKLLRD